MITSVICDIQRFYWSAHRCNYITSIYVYTADNNFEPIIELYYVSFIFPLSRFARCYDFIYPQSAVLRISVAHDAACDVCGSIIVLLEKIIVTFFFGARHAKVAKSSLISIDFWSIIARTSHLFGYTNFADTLGAPILPFLYLLRFLPIIVLLLKESVTVQLKRTDPNFRIFLTSIIHIYMFRRRTAQNIRLRIA